MAAPSPVLHWHGDTFDLPADATRLASNEIYPNQAFSYGRRILALQFHLEADLQRLESWFVGHAAELSALKVSLDSLRAQTAAAAAHAKRLAAEVFGGWLAQTDQLNG